MLAQLSTVKARLALLETDLTYDALLTSAIKALSARFDRECSRTFARAVDTTFEFDALQTEISPVSYPVESVSRFELKASESEGWIALQTPAYVIRHACIISLPQALGTRAFPLARLTYTGGYVLPGTAPGFGQVSLPADLEDAAVEQIAFWFQRRDRLGIHTNWPSGGVYQQYVVQDLLPGVEATLARYRRWST